MADVRKDTEGIPKAAVFEHSAHEVHRSAVTAADGSYPANTDSAINSDGWEVVDYDIEVTAIEGEEASIEVAPIYWNPLAEKWFKGESDFLTATGTYRLRAEARGAYTFLAVESFTGDSFSLNVWSSKS